MAANEDALTKYLAELIESGQAKPCSSCGTTTAFRIILMVSGPAWGKVVCDNCDERYIMWAKRPDKPTRKRTSKSTGLLEAIREARKGEPLYCYWCLSDERYLPTDRWMIAHHILEHQDNGTDDLSNLMPLCNKCHDKVHLARKWETAPQVGKDT